MAAASGCFRGARQETLQATSLRTDTLLHEALPFAPRHSRRARRSLLPCECVVDCNVMGRSGDARRPARLFGPTHSRNEADSFAAARAASAHWQPGGLGGGRYLLSQPECAHGGVEERRRRRFL